MTPAARTNAQAKQLLSALFMTGVAAASPSQVLPQALQTEDFEPALLIAAGKAAVEMAEAALNAGVRPKRGLVIARRPQGRPLERLEVVEAGHPTPDAASVSAALRVLELGGRMQDGERVLALLSGGASALLCAPGDGLSLHDKQALTVSLLRSGATIDEINVVRRHLSRIKGGRLAAAIYPAETAAYAISDVVGDAPEAIASGPTVGDPTTLLEARAILRRYGVSSPAAGWSESCDPSDPRLARSSFQIVASAGLSLAAVRAAVQAQGFQPVDLGESLQGEAREIGDRHGEVVRERLKRPGRFAFVSGGELTVTVQGRGRGGPNFEYAAALARRLDGASGVWGLCGDTDGLDGDSGAAGAFVFGDTAGRIRRTGGSLDDALTNNDTGRAFAAIDDVFAPGPTGTNVNDLRIVLVET